MYNLNQIKLLQKRNDIKKSIVPFEIDNNQINYIKKFISSNKKSIKIIFVLLTLLILSEIFLSVILGFYLKQLDLFFDLGRFYLNLFILIFILIIYVFLNYFVIKKQKTLILNFINKIRHDLLDNLYQKNGGILREKEKNKLIVKLSYHLSLLQMGLNNSFLNFTQIIFYTIGLFIISFFLGFNFVLVSIGTFIFSIFLFFAGYWYSNNFLSKEQTFYSKILERIISSFHNFNLLKINKKEKDVLDEIDNLVEIDNFFRIRREILLRIGNSVIFSCLILVSFFVFTFDFVFRNFQLTNLNHPIVYGIFIFLNTRLIYTYFKTGLFYYPFKLGLILCIPEFVKNHIQNNNISNINKIVFKNKKVKFDKKGKYYKNLSFIFEKNKRYLIVSNGRLNKNLAEIFSGWSAKIKNPGWIIKINEKQRFLYKKYVDFEKPVFYVNPYFDFEDSVFNILDGEYNFYHLKQYKVFDFIFEHDKFTGRFLNKKDLNMEELAILQILMCILKKIEIVLVDSFFVDVKNENINKAIEILSLQTKPIIVHFTEKKDSNILVDKNYYV